DQREVPRRHRSGTRRQGRAAHPVRPLDRRGRTDHRHPGARTRWWSAVRALNRSFGKVMNIDEVTPGNDEEVSAASGKYRSLLRLDSGGMAEVFLAVAHGPAGFNKLFVLKRLREALAESDDHRDMFLH